MKKQNILRGLILTLFLISLYSCGGGRHVTCDAYGKVDINSKNYSK